MACLRQNLEKHTLAGRTSPLSSFKGYPLGLNAHQSKCLLVDAAWMTSGKDVDDLINVNRGIISAIRVNYYMAHTAAPYQWARISEAQNKKPR